MCTTDYVGSFTKVDPKFYYDYRNSFSALDAVRKKYGIKDNVTMSVKQNHNLIATMVLDYEEFNMESKGWTAKNSNGIKLANKTTGFQRKYWTCNFADTSDEKAKKFKPGSVEVALSVTLGANSVGFIVHGFSDILTDLILAKIATAKNRISQSFTLGRLLSLGFTVRCVDMTEDEVKVALKAKYPRLDINTVIFD